jgi:hypothetical protein
MIVAAAGEDLVAEAGVGGGDEEVVIARGEVLVVKQRRKLEVAKLQGFVDDHDALHPSPWRVPLPPPSESWCPLVVGWRSKVQSRH